MRLNWIGVAGLLLLSVATNAAALTIDFEGVTLGTRSPVSIDGFVFSTMGMRGEITENVRRDDRYFRGLASCGMTCRGPYSALLYREDGQSFSFFGGDFEPFSTAGPASLRTLGLMEDGSSAAGDWGTGDWLQVTTLRFSVYVYNQSYANVGLKIDDVVVGSSVVPIPAAAWLFGSAFAALGWLKRRQCLPIA